MVLHVFAKGINHSSKLEKCLAVASSEDAVIFIEDGVFWSSPSPMSTKFLHGECNFYYLCEDAEIRGIEQFLPYAKPVTYEGFVDLTVVHKNSVSWF